MVPHGRAAGAECESKAEALFKWCNFAREFRRPAGKPVLAVNLDESSIPLYAKPSKGYVIFGTQGRRAVLRRGPGPCLSMRRSSISLIATVCDDPAVQAQLPQVFVSNMHVLTKADIAYLNDRSSPNHFFLHRKSSWVNAELLVEIVGLLARCLGTVVQTHRVVLFMDALRAHLRPSVLQACAAAGLFVVVIPACTTAWLQPLDVSVFGRYKQWVRRELERRRLAVASGKLARADVVGIYAQGLREVVERNSWESAFAATGLRGQANLSSELLLRLKLDVPRAIPASLPTLENLQCIFPKGAVIPLDDLFALFVQLERPVQLRLPLRARLPAVARAPLA